MNSVSELWLRLHFLVPDPQCQTFNDDIDRTVWNDSRAQPTEQQLRAVTQAQCDSVRPSEVKRVLVDSLKAKLQVVHQFTDAELDVLI